MHAKIFFVLASNGVGIRIPVRPENGSLVTDAVSVSDVAMTMIVDINNPDLIVPICPGGGLDCLDPHASGSFRYCSGESFCFDRQFPTFQCASTVPSSEWNVDSSELSDHFLNIDGTPITIKSFELIESIFLRDKRLDRVPAKGAVNFSRAILGLGPSRTSCRNETLLSGLGYRYIEMAPDEIRLSPDITTETHWTPIFHNLPTNSSMVLGKYAFNMINPTVCGVDIMGAASSQWTTIIDTTVECLVLPAFMHDNLKAWKSGSDGFLYFSTDHSDPSLFVGLNLSDVCIQSRTHIDASVGLTGKNPIVFGHRALQAIGTVMFETNDPFRLAFPTRSQISTECSIRPAVCIGQQTYERASNACQDPNCGQFFFGQLDITKKTCEMKSFIPTFLFTTIMALLLGELIVCQIRKKSNSISAEACERS